MICSVYPGHRQKDLYADPSVKFAPTYSEGPCAVKVGDEWSIYFDVYREGRFGAVSTKDFKNFTPIDDQISIPQGHKHGTIIKVPRISFTQPESGGS